MATGWLPQTSDVSEYDENYERVRDAIVTVLGPHPSTEEVRTLRGYVDTILAAVDAHAHPTVRALAPGEPGYDLSGDAIVAQQENTEAFFVFLVSRPSAGNRDADPR